MRFHYICGPEENIRYIQVKAATSFSDTVLNFVFYYNSRLKVLKILHQIPAFESNLADLLPVYT